MWSVRAGAEKSEGLVEAISLGHAADLGGAGGDAGGTGFADAGVGAAVEGTDGAAILEWDADMAGGFACGGALGDAFEAYAVGVGAFGFFEGEAGEATDA